MRLDDLGARDGWTCWVCEGDVDPDAPRASPSAPSIDHVVPRSKGGGSEATNVRLAHRRCNGRRGSHLPELEWPERFHVALDQAPLWQSLQRLRRKEGSEELVAVVHDEATAGEATAWVVRAATRILGDGWTTRTAPVLGGRAVGVWLRLRRAG